MIKIEEVRIHIQKNILQIVDPYGIFGLSTYKMYLEEALDYIQFDDDENIVGIGNTRVAIERFKTNDTIPYIAKVPLSLKGIFDNFEEYNEQFKPNNNFIKSDLEPNYRCPILIMERVEVINDHSFYEKYKTKYWQVGIKLDKTIVGIDMYK